MIEDSQEQYSTASAARGMPNCETAPGARPAVSRRTFLAGLGAGLAEGALAACSPPSGNRSRNAGGPVQLVYQDSRTEWFPGMVQEMLEQFHAIHPNIHVFYTPEPDNLQDQILADMDSGIAPDVMAGCCEFLPIWAEKGHLLDLRPFVEADLDRATINDWDTIQYESLSTRSGMQYALPRSLGALALYYNRDMFDEHGVDYPDGRWTYEDYLGAMKRLTGERDADGRQDRWGSMMDIAWERIQVHVNSWGGHFVDPQNPKRCLMVEPEAMAALRWLRARIWEDHCMANFLDVQNLSVSQAFVQERLAMVEDGSWALKNILEGARFRVGVAPFPAGPARKVTLAATDGYAIYADTQYPEAAWELLKFLTSREYGRAMARTHLLQPARASLLEEWISFAQLQYPEKARDLDIAAFTEGRFQGYSVVAETFPLMEKPRSIAKAAWEQIFTLGRAPVEMMYEVTAQIEEAQQAV